MDQMTQQTQSTGRAHVHDGEDFVCPNCGCEIMVKHTGDQSKMRGSGHYTCCCGTEMRPEHAQDR